MIDWGSLAANAIWIFGCALALATLSYASWQAYQSGQKLSIQLKQPQLQTSLNLAGLLFCIGLLLTAGSILKMVLWAALGIFFLIQLVGAARPTKHRESSSGTHGSMKE